MADETEAPTPDAEAPAAGAPAPEAPKPDAPKPAQPEVRRMDNALERGDFREAQEIARRLAASDDPDLRRAGEEGLERYRLDPTVLAVLAFTGLLLAFLATHYLGHRH